MADNRENEKRAVEALTGATIEVSDAMGEHDENLTAKGARDVIDKLKVRDLKIVAVE